MTMRRSKTRRAPGEPTLHRDERGAYQLEYLAVLVLVSLVTAFAIATVAIPLVLYHASIREAVTSPVP
ncbi:hypothetical protein [Sandaracinus amylolyticus]|uniref:hypothetical protein n=1 Tax=Sandaracinus amylolyticus TaxID=927083 RepID=UPI001F263A7C|nr:hypothetical protein [Sandaracinus amylolyticus]UJR79092.1 Hypothetical protein I5071_11250 [Sandaracinus amylolyticus]